MKHIYLTLAIIVTSITLNAQLSPNSIAPNFTTTDINGNEITLYDLLDEGKTVILDIFAVWCPPCWSYHQGHTLEDAFTTYGPNGTDELFVLAVEADPTTLETCILSADDCNGFSYGDWTEGISYPVTDDAAIGDAYQISYYPTLYIIYPNRLVTEMGQVSPAELEDWLAKAPQLQEGTNAEVINYSGLDGALCSSSWVHGPTYTVSNMGEETITSVDITITKNGETYYSNSWTGIAEPYEIITQFLATPQILSENSEFILTLSNINGTAETKEYITGVSFNVENTIGVSVQTDASSVEDNNYYTITDSDGNVIINQSVAEVNVLHERVYDLPSQGCYTFSIYDDAGNGINGDITVRDIAGNIIYRSNGFTIEGGNDFFVGTVTNVEEVYIDNKYSVVQNPIQDRLLLTSNSEVVEEVNYTIVDGLGRVIQTNSTLFSNQLNIDVSDLKNGSYFINVNSDTSRQTLPFVKL